MSVVDEIKDRLDIVEVISSYVPLEKSGRNYKALCPFHAEKTPSFVVFPDSQNWHCFGACGEGGDLFSFVMKHEGWDFRTALEELARLAGVELRPQTPAQVQREEEAERLRGLLAVAADYYHELLLHAPQAQAARQYVEQRGLSTETVETFLMGYSLPSWEGLRGYLLERDFTLDEMIKAGVQVERDGGGSYDRFRDRVMIPIRDRRGRVIGFGARTLDPDGVPKYLNSPQSLLFDKSHVLYGLDLAQRSIRDQGVAVIVEGYMDVMQAYQAGFKNVVAQMGTALTDTQLRKLHRYTDRFVLALDPDVAGVNATLRGIEMARETLADDLQPIFDPRGLVGFDARLDTEIRVLQLPPGKDPDDLIREDVDRWARLVAAAKPVVEFVMDQLLAGADLTDAKMKKRIVDELLPLLRMVADPVERNTYAQRLVRVLDISAPQFLHELERRVTRSEGRARPRQVAPLSDMLERPQVDLEAHCLALLICREDVVQQVNNELRERQLEMLKGEDFQNPAWRALFQAWTVILRGDEVPSWEALRASLPVELHGQLERVFEASGGEIDGDQLVRNAVRTVLRLREPVLSRRVQELGLLIDEAHESGDYAHAWRAHMDALLRTQRALSRG